MKATKSRSVISKWSADAEALLMGFTVPVESGEHWQYMMNYTAMVLGFEIDTEEVLRLSKRYLEDPEHTVVRHLNLSSIEDMRMFAMTYEGDNDEEPYNLLNPDGCFGYVYNVDCKDFSELGYSYYKKDGSRIKRIG